MSSSIRFSNVALASGIAMMMLTGCSKKLSQFQADYFSVNPNPLEVVGDRVPATVSASIPAKFFVKDAQVTVTPYLCYDGGEVSSQPYSFQGEKVRGNSPVISYDNGGSVTIPVMYNYSPEMLKSTLQLAFNVTQGSKQYALPRVTVAEGCVATSDLADAKSVSPALAPDKFQRIINEKYNADIHFLINQANVRDNQKNSSEMTSLSDQLKAASGDSKREIEEINISSYASPEGSLDFNTKLAEKREVSTTDYMKGRLKKDNVTEFGELTANFTPEDWEGFQQLVAASNIQDKELILSVLSMYKDPEEREREIRNLSSIFDQLADQILPQLRKSRITASINVIGKSDEEILDYLANNPSQLSVDEVLYAATLYDNNADKMTVYRKACELYPNDYRCFNNLGLTQYVAGDYDSARSNFNKAASLNAAAGEPQMNLGLISLINKDYRIANQKFGSAAGVEELNDAMGTYYLMTGDAASAVKAFGQSKSNNAALAQILTKDYSKAKSTLGAIDNPDATTYYLTAVLGARTNNDSMVNSNLRQAVKLDSSLATRAANDLEFKNFNLSAIL
jgi:tetratricopeptide (TPR) repeat protein/outer membrane protein OmpA-like peptidoglycan-associated protein